MFFLILFGPPGSGKGTQAEKLLVKYNLKHLSTGDLLRGEIVKNTPLGLAAKAFIDKGQLVPDELVIGIIDDCLKNNPGFAGFLLDGFPRTAPQAKALDNLLELKSQSIDLMVALDVSEAELLKRLLKRGETSGRSDDTNESIITERIAEYHRKTTAVAEYYKRADKVILVPGEGSVDDIFARICSVVDKKMVKASALK